MLLLVCLTGFPFCRKYRHGNFIDRFEIEQGELVNDP